jgi:hypothetical protein
MAGIISFHFFCRSQGAIFDALFILGGTVLFGWYCIRNSRLEFLSNLG